MAEDLNLKEGEVYVGCYSIPAGNLIRVILLPGDADPARWHLQKAWAESLGGDLPNRIEQSMLFNLLRDQFKPAWYWSNEIDGSYAWYQFFGSGTQNSSLTHYELRARAVRREAI